MTGDCVFDTEADCRFITKLHSSNLLATVDRRWAKEELLSRTLQQQGSVDFRGSVLCDEDRDESCTSCVWSERLIRKGVCVLLLGRGG